MLAPAGPVRAGGGAGPGRSRRGGRGLRGAAGPAAPGDHRRPHPAVALRGGPRPRAAPDGAGALDRRRVAARPGPHAGRRAVDAAGRLDPGPRPPRGVAHPLPAARRRGRGGHRPGDAGHRPQEPLRVGGRRPPPARVPGARAPARALRQGRAAPAQSRHRPPQERRVGEGPRRLHRGAADLPPGRQPVGADDQCAVAGRPRAADGQVRRSRALPARGPRALAGRRAAARGGHRPRVPRRPGASTAATRRRRSRATARRWRSPSASPRPGTW